MPAVVLLSGGLDSTVCFQLTLAESPSTEVITLTADYGQRAAAREVGAARRMADSRGVRHVVLDLRWLGGITETALCRADQALPEPSADELDDAAADRSAARVWVPNRNGLLINAAATYAESLGAGARVVVGFNREEAATFPDNSSLYVERATAALALSTATGVRVWAPTVRLDKAEIVARGREIGAPLEHVWVCYRGGEKHCGRCESCARFQRALDRANAAAWWRELRAAVDTPAPTEALS